MQDLKAEKKGEMIRSNQKHTQEASFFFLAVVFMRLLASLPSSVFNTSNIYFQQKLNVIVYFKGKIGINQECGGGGVTTMSQII